MSLTLSGTAGPTQKPKSKVQASDTARHVGEGVVGQLLVDVRVDHQHRGGRLQQDAAVGRRTLHRLHGDLAAGARLVLDQRRLGIGAAAQMPSATRRQSVSDVPPGGKPVTIFTVSSGWALRPGAARNAEGGECGGGGRMADESAAVGRRHGGFLPYCWRFYNHPGDERHLAE